MPILSDQLVNGKSKRRTSFKDGTHFAITPNIINPKIIESTSM